MFGTNITAAAPGSAQGMHLVVSDIDNVRENLLRRDIAVSYPFHDVGGIFHHSKWKGHHGWTESRSQELRVLNYLRRPRQQRLDGAGDYGPPPWNQGRHAFCRSAL
jgi:hypothetical protein